VSTVRYTNEEIRKRKGHVDHAKINAATEEQIAAWKHEDGIDDANFGPARAVPPITDVHALREKLSLSQEEFAERYMLSLRTIQEWEQRRREPSDAARVLLYAIAQDPAAIARVLHPSAA
jgi:DNA-binding transcriptional regulator YiaG